MYLPGTNGAVIDVSGFLEGTYGCWRVFDGVHSRLVRNEAILRAFLSRTRSQTRSWAKCGGFLSCFPPAQTSPIGKLGFSKIPIYFKIGIVTKAFLAS